MWLVVDTPSVEERLEAALKAYLQAKTQLAPYAQQLAACGLKNTQKAWVWIEDEDEAEQQRPWIKVRKVSAARFGQGYPIIQGIPPFQRETWRLIFDIEADENSGGLRTDKNSFPAHRVLSSMIKTIFMQPAGRAELEALGIHNIRSIDEGEKSLTGTMTDSQSFICDTCVEIAQVVSV